jgi:hypothetical protein
VAARQLDVIESIRSPSVYVNGYEIRSDLNSPYAAMVEVGGKPRMPEEREGQAFVPISREERYGIRLFNRSNYDLAVEIWIDGISMFEFTEPEFRNYQWVVIPKKTDGLIRGWHRNNSASDAFEVTAYSKSAVASVLPKQKRIGTITLVFRRAWEPGKRPPLDEPTLAQRSEGDATGRGPSVDQKYALATRIAGVPCAVVTIRYTKPQDPDSQAKPGT